MIQNLVDVRYNNLTEELQFNIEEIEEIQEEAQVIEGYFPRDLYEKEMYINKINKTLCIILGVFIVIAMFSYYFVTLNEINMNKLSRETTLLNDENAELQYKLDKLKSFNNVDMTIQKNKSLARAKQVLEVPEVNSSSVVYKNTEHDKVFSYSIGY